MAYFEGDQVENDQGERLALVGGAWVPVQAQPQDQDVPMPEAPQPADPLAPATDSTEFMGMQWPGNGPLDSLAAFPVLGDAGGLETAVNAVRGAVPMVTRAAGAVGGAGERAAQMLGRGAAEVAPGDGYAFGMTGRLPPAPPAAPEIASAATMADRVLGKMGEAAAVADDAPRWREGLHTAEELDQLGIPMLPGRRAALTAKANDPDAIARAEAQMLREDTFGAAGGPIGANHMAAMAQTKKFLDEAVAGAAGLPRGVAFDGPMISQRMAEVGDTMSEIGRDAGWIKFDQGDIGRMKEMVDSLSESQAVPLRRQVAALEKYAGEYGTVSGQEYQNVYSRLNKMTQAGEDQEKIAGAVELMKSMEDSLALNLTKDQLAALKQARYQYRILSRMKKPGAINEDGSINPRSFRRSWAKGTSPSSRRADPIGKLTETVDMLTQKRAHTGNTLQRFFDNAPGAVQAQAGNGLVGAAAGLAATVGAGLLGL